MGKTTTIIAKRAYIVEKENIDPFTYLRSHLLQRAERNMREKVEFPNHERPSPYIFQALYCFVVSLF
jgi:hypothetical protein